MIGLYGTEKQIKFAGDIKNIVIYTLEKYKEVYPNSLIYVNRAITDISMLSDAGYIINQLKEVCYTKKFYERMAIITEYMAYSSSPAYYRLIDNIDEETIKMLKYHNVDIEILKELRYIH